MEQEGEGEGSAVKRKGEVDDENEEEDATGSNRASKRRQVAKANSASDEETGVGANEGGRKVKAVKQKKIFLRILRNVMDLPPDSHLLRVWRGPRQAKKSGKMLEAGWQGIEVMHVEEVDATLCKLLPSYSPSKVGAQDPRLTIAEILGIDMPMAEMYISLKRGRYRLNEDKLSPAAAKTVERMRLSAKQLHTELAQDDRQAAVAAATGGGCTAPLLHPLHPVSLPTAQGQTLTRAANLGDPSNDNSGNPDTPTVHMSGSAFSSLWNTLSNPAHGFLPEPQSNTSGELYGNAGGMWNPSSLPSLSLSQGGSFSLSSLSSLRGFSQLPLIPPVTGPPPSHDPSQSTTPTTAYLPGLTNAPQTNAPQELVGANAHLQIAAHMAPLRCRDCRRPISCMCPLLMRLKTHSQNHYLDAVYTVMLGQACQYLWELAEHMPLDKLQELSIHVSIIWGALAGRMTTLQSLVARSTTEVPSTAEARVPAPAPNHNAAAAT